MWFTPKKIYTTEEGQAIIGRITEKVRPHIEKYIDAIKERANSAQKGEFHTCNFLFTHKEAGNFEVTVNHEVRFLNVQREIQDALTDENIPISEARSKSTQIAYQITKSHEDWLSRILADALTKDFFNRR